MQAARVSDDVPPPTENSGALLCTKEQAATLNDVLTDKNIVIGAYFTQKVHPQHGVSVQPASFDYIADWFHSAVRLGLNMIILHDGLPEKFMDKCRFFFSMHSRKDTHGSLHFVPYSPGRFTIADERFFAARDILAALSHCHTAFIVDISDAWFNRNPAHLVLRRTMWDYFDASRLLTAAKHPASWREALVQQYSVWKTRNSYSIFIGGEINTIGENPWMMNHLQSVYEQKFPEFSSKPVLNCGIIGGKRANVLALLRNACAEMERVNKTDRLNDMAVFNYLLHRNDNFTVYSNGTLNSPWKTWSKSGTHAIFHK
ncbi:hypothetical protein [Halodesulfovibrio sp.]|jgi:hypothetical protein|uniref:hypothetical protein n=1 Tax=Halodesulfovibrio sp. TaxID=1912772 RepID=UPI0025D34ACB|nr:hypothetical protein [Halodesulfovibrio sp.]MCT4626039.1 hypothetical protein [Halodesulfovibrio sp.]